MTELKDIKDIHVILEMFGVRTLIETGCYKGDGIEQALKLGAHDIHSCDINERWVIHCRGRFPGAHLHFGSSVETLPSMCEDVVAPALFWLDAHLPEMYGVKAKGHDMPVLEEIDVIKRHKRHFERDVIVIDDTRILKSEDNPRFTPGETIICDPIEGISIKDIVSKLERTHKAKHHHDHEGYIVFTPMGKHAK